MSVGTTAAIVAGSIAAAGAVGSAAIGAHAAGSAADKQVTASNNALDFQKQVYADQQANQAPYLAAGKTSLGKIMEGFNNGTFGPGSIAPFTAPTAAEAAATPGYQFTQQQGQRGVLAAASAGGRSLSGGTLKAIDQYNTGLANTTYGDTFNRALSTYQAKLTGQAQDYNELAGIAGTGQTATQSINNTGTQVSQNVGNLMTGIGNAQAAGTIGQANAITGAIGSGTNTLQQLYLLNALGLGGGYNPNMPTINPSGGLGGQPLAPPPVLDPAQLGPG